MNVKKQIEKFISKISLRYPMLHIEYEYDNDNEEFIIWHNDPDLEFNNNEFNKYVGEKADEYLFGNRIYNFSFGYDHYKAKDLEKRIMTFDTTKINKVIIEYTENSVTEESSYTCNLDSSVKFENSIVYNETSWQSVNPYTYSLLNYAQLDDEVIYRKNEFEEAA